MGELNILSPEFAALIADTDAMWSMGCMAFSYRISLQVRHPDADPDMIVRGIGLPVIRSWRVGEARATPRGNPLPGHYRDTYCAFEIGDGDKGDLAQHLRDTVASLSPRQDFIQSLRAIGGRLNFYVSWTVGERGEVFDIALLADLANLGIDRGIEPIGND